MSDAFWRQALGLDPGNGVPAFPPGPAGNAPASSYTGGQPSSVPTPAFGGTPSAPMGQGGIGSDARYPMRDPSMGPVSFPGPLTSVAQGGPFVPGVGSSGGYTTNLPNLSYGPSYTGAPTPPARPYTPTPPTAYGSGYGPAQPARPYTPTPPSAPAQPAQDPRFTTVQWNIPGSPGGGGRGGPSAPIYTALNLGPPTYNGPLSRQAVTSMGQPQAGGGGQPAQPVTTNAPHPAQPQGSRQQWGPDPEPRSGVWSLPSIFRPGDTPPSVWSSGPYQHGVWSLPSIQRASDRPPSLWQSTSST